MKVLWRRLPDARAFYAMRYVSEEAQCSYQRVQRVSVQSAEVERVTLPAAQS